MKKITVFTPTFNRAYLLPRLYQSLCRQSSKDFLWLVIDDGSTDNTKELIDKWICEGKIEIQYYYKKNGGMHTGYNEAYRLIKTNLNVCIDSDDYMPDDAVMKINDFWDSNGSESYAGIFALDSFHNGGIIGDKFPVALDKTTVGDVYNVHHLKGDKKIIYRTDIVTKYPPYPTFQGEKFVPIFCIPYMIDVDYPLLTMNEVVCVVEYQNDGSTKNIISSYKKNSAGFAYSRKIRMVYSPSFRDRFKNSMHYISSSLFLRDSAFLKNSPKKFLTLLSLPFGIVLHLYILLLLQKSEKK